jgi:hypothetical protein
MPDDHTETTIGDVQNESELQESTFSRELDYDGTNVNADTFDKFSR